MTLKRRPPSAISVTLSVAVILTAVSCSVIPPVPEIDCGYVDADECERAVDLALTMIARDQGSPRSIGIGDPCRGRPCPPDVLGQLAERYIIVQMFFDERGGPPIDVSVDRRDWTAWLLDPAGP